MMKLTLSDVEHHQLETTFKTTADPRLHHCCQAVLMAARGRRHSHIAADLAISPRTVQRWLNAYQVGGLEGLHIRWAPGRPPSTPDDLAPAVTPALPGGLSSHGLLAHRPRLESYGDTGWESYGLGLGGGPLD